jgi:thymidylate kinase
MPARLETAEGQTRRLDGIRRWIRPTGLCVAILGPDGSGKSSVIAQYVPQMETFFSGTEYFHLRPRLFGGTAAAQAPSTDPHGQPPRGALLSVVKILFLWADYFLGYLLRVYPRLASARLVIFDRYYHDLLVDERRFRYGGPRWLSRLVAHAIPLPDLLLILDAPAEVLQSRKREVPLKESARQAEAYRRVAISPAVHGRAALIDASQPLADVAQECADKTLAILAYRTTNRLGLD